MADFAPAVEKVIRREGGDTLTDDPADPGGLTRYGIAKRAHPEVDPRNLTRAQAEAIYRRDYWAPIRADEIGSQAVAEAIFDTAVNMGTGTALRIAQVVLGIRPDGDMGPATVAALNSAIPEDFLAAFTLAKVARYMYLVKKNRKLEKFLYGWLVRALEAGGVA